MRHLGILSRRPPGHMLYNGEAATAKCVGTRFGLLETLLPKKFDQKVVLSLMEMFFARP